jgi:hypothetical protein
LAWFESSTGHEQHGRQNREDGSDQCANPEAGAVVGEDHFMAA